MTTGPIRAAGNGDVPGLGDPTPGLALLTRQVVRRTLGG